MNSEPTIRKATLEDAASIKKCVQAAYRHYITRIGKPPGPMLDDFSMMVEHHAVYVAEAVDILGAVVMVKTGSGLLLDNVAVHPDHQGKGIGKKLISLAESEALRMGFTSLDLYTNEAMTENIAIYEAMGYAETERREESGYRRVYMRKALST